MSTEPNIKYRVTGAMVLIALAVIFLPLILDGQKKNQILNSSIPAKPISGEIILVNVEDIDSTKKNSATENIDNSKDEAVENKNSEAEVIVPTNTKVVEKRRDRPNYKSSAFVIQLGSFGSQANASKLVVKLKEAGYKAYLMEGESDGKVIYRVLVGPELKREQAESKLEALNKLSGLKVIIVSYDPLIH